MDKKKVIILILVIAVLVAAALAVFSAVHNNSLINRYPGMEWAEKAQLYEKFILRSGLIPEYYVDLKIIAELPSKNRLLFSYDYRRKHYLVYASANWLPNKIIIEPLHSELSDGSAQAIISCTRDWTKYGEEVYYGEVFDPDIVSIKVYVLAKSDPEPVYISKSFDLQNGGFMVEEPLAKVWLRDKNNALHQINLIK